MKKRDLIEQLEAAKSLSSTVDIDKVITLIKGLESSITQELADEICNQIERCLDHNCDALVDEDNVEFTIGYGNVIEVENAQIDIYETMRHISAVVDEFVNEDDGEGMEEVLM
jgi:flagellin-specific chaperone FliS